jgi:KUP system potassium uptake protein
LFFLIESAFLGANAYKIISGGWVPILFALLCSIVMISWYNGVNFLRASYYAQRTDIKEYLLSIKISDIYYLPNIIAVFIIDPYDKSGGSLFHYLNINLIMPENSVILSVTIEDKPYVSRGDRFKISKIDYNIHRINLYYGFMEVINIPLTLLEAHNQKEYLINLDPENIVYLIENTHLSTTKRKANLPFFWQEKLFAFLLRNSYLDIEFYELPKDRTIGIGRYFEI